MDASGSLYGTTSGGGGSGCGGGGCGTAFEISPASGGGAKETTLYDFSLPNAYPDAGFLMDASGNLYSTTAGGNVGSSDVFGTVFELSPGNPWTENTLYTFAGGAYGADPYSGLVSDASGNLYGITIGGGVCTISNRDYAGGAVFKLSPGNPWTETLLYTFFQSAYPYDYGSLAIDGSGNLYGTTVEGGANDQGNVFKITPTSVGANCGGSGLTTLYSFENNYTDGNQPMGAPVLDASGNLYGTTNGGGNDGEGIVWKVTPSGTEIVLHTFTGDTDGGYPEAGVVLDAAGNIYGVTPSGGDPNTSAGTVFKISSSKTFTTLYTFNGNAEGFGASGGVLIGQDGNLYGTTEGSGGGSGPGTVWGIPLSPHEYPLTVTISGPGSVTGNTTTYPGGINCPAFICSAAYAAGSAVTLTATPSAGYNFTGWGGACTGTGTCTVTMSAAAHVSATFAIQQNTLTVAVAGNGTVTSNTGGINCPGTCSASFNPGTVVTLTESPATGNYFSGWSGACSGTGTCSVTMNAAEGVTATFNAQQITTTTVSSSLNPSVYGQAVSFTATVVGNSPTGTVTFYNGATPLATQSLSAGTATLTISTLAVGSYSITAAYSGDPYNLPSSSPILTQVVSTASAGVVVTSSTNPSAVGQAVTFTATISGEYGLVKGRQGRAKPHDVSGTVAWSANGITIAGCGTTTVASGNPGVATCTTSSLATGSYTIAANYSGDANHSGSTGTLSGGQQVTSASSTTGIASSLNPSVYGQAVSFSATVTGASPTGTVQFNIDGNPFDTEPLASGVATSVTVTTLTAGTHTVTAAYSGDSNNSSSTGLLAGGQVVSPAGLNVNVGSSIIHRLTAISNVHGDDHE